MLRLLKWAALAGMAYVVYELLTSLSRSGSPVAAVASAARDAVAPSNPPPGPVLSGASHEGRATSVRNSDGGEHRTVVGRGVIRR